jgi:multicomponent Na+:H+ antiporter subunit G
MIVDAIAVVIAALGTGLILVAGVGIVRMPDLLTRMHASSKAATLGAALIILAVGIHFGGTGPVVRAILIILFLFITAPVAAHMIGRAGYRSGVKMADETVIDEYRPTVEADGGPGAGDPGSGTDELRR